MRMSQRQSYRTRLAAKGLIFIGGEELELKVKNLSLTGLLAVLQTGKKIKNIKDVFGAISSSAMVDIYIKDLQLAGEAEVVRAEVEADEILIALEFKNITYNVNDLLYKRKAYRKNMESIGHIVVGSGFYVFNTRNVSVYGMMIHIAQKLEVEIGLVTQFDFEELGIKGEIRVVWSEIEQDQEEEAGGTLIGLQYLHLENTELLNIPRFAD